jgi:hypothetical protein
MIEKEGPHNGRSAGEAEVQREANLALAPSDIQTLKLGDTTVLADADTIGQIQRHIVGCIAHAVATDGFDGLENPQSSAIVHEAGHAVVNAHFGDAVRYCKVWKAKRGVGHGQWVGFTMAGRDWRSDTTTSPDDDFRQACRVMAGVLAELLFDRENFRQGSSLDEIAVANQLAANIAIKTRRDAQEVMLQVICTTGDILKTNSDVVREIAKKLKRHRVLREMRLAPLLERVSRNPSKFDMECRQWTPDTGRTVLREGADD